MESDALRAAAVAKRNVKQKKQIRIQKDERRPHQETAAAATKTKVQVNGPADGACGQHHLKNGASLSKYGREPRNNSSKSGTVSRPGKTGPIRAETQVH